jgi:hypothetical protein
VKFLVDSAKFTGHEGAWSGWDGTTWQGPAGVAAGEGDLEGAHGEMLPHEEHEHAKLRTLTPRELKAKARRDIFALGDPNEDRPVLMEPGGHVSAERPAGSAPMHGKAKRGSGKPAAGKPEAKDSGGGGGWETGPRGGTRRKLPNGKWQYKGKGGAGGGGAVAEADTEGDGGETQADIERASLMREYPPEKHPWMYYQSEGGKVPDEYKEMGNKALGLSGDADIHTRAMAVMDRVSKMSPEDVAQVSAKGVALIKQALKAGKPKLARAIQHMGKALVRMVKGGAKDAEKEGKRAAKRGGGGQQNIFDFLLGLMGATLNGGNHVASHLLGLTGTADQNKPPPRQTKKSFVTPGELLRKEMGPGSAPRDRTPAIPNFNELFYQPETDERKQREAEAAAIRRRAGAAQFRGRIGFHGAAELEPELRWEPHDQADPRGPKLGQREPILVSEPIERIAAGRTEPGVMERTPEEGEDDEDEDDEEEQRSRKRRRRSKLAERG